MVPPASVVQGFDLAFYAQESDVAQDMVVGVGEIAPELRFGAETNKVPSPVPSVAAKGLEYPGEAPIRLLFSIRGGPPSLGVYDTGHDRAPLVGIGTCAAIHANRVSGLFGLPLSDANSSAWGA
jgi:hypothetical protein